MVLYILIYGVMNLGAFSVVIGMSREAPGLLVSDFAGLGQRAPALALAMAMFMVSLAGIPPLAGFWAKFFIFRAGIDRGGWGVWLAAIMVINSVISLVYYINVVRPMFFVEAEEAGRPLRVPAPINAVVALAALSVVVVFIQPDLFAHWTRLATLVK